MTDSIIGNNTAQLKSIVDRAINLEDQKKEIGNDLKDLWQEAKSSGFDVAALKEIVKINREDGPKKEKRASKEAMLEVYLQALGQLSDTPLGQAAIAGISKGARR